MIHLPKTGELSESLPVAPDALQPATPNEPTGVLFPEAKQRERRRRLIVLGAAILVLGGTGLGLALSNSTAGPGPHHAVRLPVSISSIPKALALPTGAVVNLRAPSALAVSSAGTLYVADESRDQVLERLTNGQFAVVAGDGKAGFAGDGGPATAAELNDPTGLAVAPSGALYIADRGNGRVREVETNGIIRTVAGDGPGGWSTGRTPALRTSLNAVSALALGNGGKLYMGGDELSVLLPNGTVSWLAGTRANTSPDCGGRAVEATFTTITSLVLDGSGDVFASTNLCREIVELTASGKLVRVLSAGNGEGVTPIGGNGLGNVFTGGEGVWNLSERRYASGLDADTILGRGPAGEGQVFMVHHVAVASDGTIYADNEVGGTWSSVSAIAEIPRHGRAVLLWKS